MTSQVTHDQPSQTLALGSEEKQLTKRWITLGIAAGILGDIAYASAIAPVPLPDTVRMILGFAFGPLITLAFVGIYHFFKLHRNHDLCSVWRLPEAGRGSGQP